MASERELASDSDEAWITKVPEGQLQYVKERLLHYISETKDFSAEIRHNPGQPAQMTFTIGSSGSQKPAYVGTSNKILVKNLPPAYDKEHLQMFFEYEKGQGGGPVKSVTLNTEINTAIVEFEKSHAVSIVMSKRPIKIMDKTVEVDVFMPCLETGEALDSVTVKGLPRQLAEDLVTLYEKEMQGVAQREIKVGDTVKLVKFPRSRATYLLLKQTGVGIGGIGIVTEVFEDTLTVNFAFTPCQLHKDCLERVWVSDKSDGY